MTFAAALLHLNTLEIVRAGGYLGLAILVYAESGLLIGVVLPGDSVLFAAGLLAAGGLFNPIALAAVIALAAILGDSTGYWFGKSIGVRLFNRTESWLFKGEYLARTQAFYKKYGARAVVLARFVPVVRTIAPILAGVGEMPYGRFLAYNAIGGVLWGAGMVLLGYSLGSVIPNSEHYILPLSLLIIVLSFLPVLINLLRRNPTA